VRCRDAKVSTFVANARKEVFANFHADAVRLDSLSWKECFVNSPLDVKENYDHSLHFVLHISRAFSVSVSFDFLCTAHAFFPERLSNHCQGLRRTSSEICTKFGAIRLSDPSRNSTSPNIRT
jgi:hypothetical protein